MTQPRKKTAPKKTAPKKATKKAPTRKAPARKTPAKKAAPKKAKKTTKKKSPAKKAAAGKTRGGKFLGFGRKDKRSNEELLEDTSRHARHVNMLQRSPELRHKSTDKGYDDLMEIHRRMKRGDYP